MSARAREAEALASVALPEVFSSRSHTSNARSNQPLRASARARSASFSPSFASDDWGSACIVFGAMSLYVAPSAMAATIVNSELISRLVYGMHSAFHLGYNLDRK